MPPCKGCGAGWTAMGTGYCGNCLDKMNMTPPPIPLDPNAPYGWDNKPGRKKPENN